MRGPTPCRRGDRRPDCAGYRTCLGVASRDDWPSFSCNGCSDYQPQTRDEQRAEYVALAELGALLVLALELDASDKQVGRSVSCTSLRDPTRHGQDPAQDEVSTSLWTTWARHTKHTAGYVHLPALDWSDEP